MFTRAQHRAVDFEQIEPDQSDESFKRARLSEKT